MCCFLSSRRNPFISGAQQPSAPVPYSSPQAFLLEMVVLARRLGTLDELFESLTLIQTGRKLADSPCVVAPQGFLMERPALISRLPDREQRS